jgi:hypothetical protein
MFRINEEDLSTLEQEIPELLNAAIMTCNNPISRKRWDIVKTILSNVRWGYGPPLSVEILQ